MNILQIVFVALCAPFISAKGASLIHRSSPPSDDHDIKPTSEEDLISPYCKDTTYIIFDHNLKPYGLQGSIATSKTKSLQTLIKYISFLESFTSTKIFIGFYNPKTNDYSMKFFIRKELGLMFEEKEAMSFILNQHNILHVIHKNHTDMTNVKNKKNSPFYSKIKNDIIEPFSSSTKFLLIGPNGRPFSLESGIKTACSSADSIEELILYLSEESEFKHLFITIVELAIEGCIIRRYERELKNEPLMFIKNSYQIVDGEEYMLSYETVLRILEIPSNEPSPKANLLPLFANDVDFLNDHGDRPSPNFDIIEGKPVNYFGLLNMKLDVQFTIIHHNLFSIFLEKARMSGRTDDIFVIDLSDTTHPSLASILVFKRGTDGHFRFDDDDVMIMKKSSYIEQFRFAMSL